MPRTSNPKYIKAIDKLKEAIVHAVDAHFGEPPNTLPGPQREAVRRERDRVLISALLELAARCAVQDRSELGAAQLFLNFVIYEKFGQQSYLPADPG